ncbi:hypothetical protein K402DRAFT_425193 [Aulographum hederae CBS 113979]|uniref:Uncharacterized protein n=1 Tax=Aulographum hederae CBS 113979 TaxID=1176131 RepID=A0A6G1GL60_9PEZI|nr:hypothetical protein K402DRAFT_425193 [Aulographum hederae CBS 113979]
MSTVGKKASAACGEKRARTELKSDESDSKIETEMLALKSRAKKRPKTITASIDELTDRIEIWENKLRGTTSLTQNSTKATKKHVASLGEFRDLLEKAVEKMDRDKLRSEKTNLYDANKEQIAKIEDLQKRLNIEGREAAYLRTVITIKNANITILREQLSEKTGECKAKQEELDNGLSERDRIIKAKQAEIDKLMGGKVEVLRAKQARIAKLLSDKDAALEANRIEIESLKEWQKKIKSAVKMG